MRMMMMIPKKQLEFYKDKKVKIVLKNNFQYIGEIIELFEETLMFKDRYDGTMTIPYEEIRLINEYREEK